MIYNRHMSNRIEVLPNMLNNVLDRINAKAALYNKIEHKIPESYLQQFKQAFDVDFAHNSTAIEGNTLTFIETKLLLEDKISVGGKDLREIYEVINHQKAFDYVKEEIGKRHTLDSEIVKEIHSKLMDNIFIGGIYRDGPARITGASFIPPSGEMMMNELRNFYADFSWMKNKNPIEYAAWTHAEFVRIHPFPDGNGRTSRMIMNYQLMAAGLLPISIQKNDRLEYYKALDDYAAKKDLSSFTEFLAVREEKALDEYLDIAVSLKIISELDIKIAMAKSESKQISNNINFPKRETREK